MRLPLLFATAIFTPILLCATLLLPSYGSIYGACYIIYDSAKGNPLADKYLEIFNVLDTYQALLNYWLDNRTALGFVDYTLPIAFLPFFGCGFALWLTYKLSKRLINFFHLSASV